MKIVDEHNKCNKECLKCVWNLSQDKNSSCFWIYIKDRSDSKGEMKEMTDLEISKLLNISVDEVIKCQNEAMEKLKPLLLKESFNSISLTEEKDQLESLNDSLLKELELKEIQQDK